MQADGETRARAGKQRRPNESELALTHVCDASLDGLDGPLQKSLGQIVGLFIQVLVQVKTANGYFNEHIISHCHRGPSQRTTSNPTTIIICVAMDHRALVLPCVQG